ncbi:MAG TPA: hypothetical protein PKV84_06450 [Candidatus Omnitrophota bacterium]|nr:hypothetical protein [Candidatus Omnitrophota bacterium]
MAREVRKQDREDAREAGKMRAEHLDKFGVKDLIVNALKAAGYSVLYWLVDRFAGVSYDLKRIDQGVDKGNSKAKENRGIILKALENSGKADLITKEIANRRGLYGERAEAISLDGLTLSEIYQTEVGGKLIGGEETINRNHINLVQQLRNREIGMLLYEDEVSHTQELVAGHAKDYLMRDIRGQLEKAKAEIEASKETDPAKQEELLEELFVLEALLKDTSARTVGDFLKILNRFQGLKKEDGTDLFTEGEKEAHLNAWAVLLEKTGIAKALIAEGDSIIAKNLGRKETLRQLMGLYSFSVALAQGWAGLHSSQVMAAWIMAQGWNIAELATGEGKSAVGALAAFVNSYTKKGSFIVTTTDMLAKRDAEGIASRVSRLTGRTVGLIQDRMDNAAKTQNYAKDVTFVSVKNLMFDVSHDVLTAKTDGEKVIRRDVNGWFKDVSVIVDEADSVLIDQSMTSFIRASRAGEITGVQREIRLAFAKMLDQEEGGFGKLRVGERVYRIENGKRVYDDVAERYNQEAMSQLDAIWSPSGAYAVATAKGEQTALGILRELQRNGTLSKEAYELLVTKNKAGETVLTQAGKDYLSDAIQAEYLYREGEKYFIRSGEIILVDKDTGVTQDGQRLNRLHQAIEAKEYHLHNPNVTTIHERSVEIKIQGENQTSSSLSARNGIRRFGRVSGMTGTAAQGKAPKQFKELYGLTVREVPTHNIRLRHDHEVEIAQTDAESLARLKAIVIHHLLIGQPILINTLDVNMNNQIADFLEEVKKELGEKAQGIPIRRFNAAIQAEGEGVIELAGQGGIVVATNIAGRGTDIKISEELQEKGGLVQISIGMNDTVRADTQTKGRAGRQGAVGETYTLLSLERDRGFLERGLLNIPGRSWRGRLARLFKQQTREQKLYNQAIQAGVSTKETLKAFEVAQRNIENYNAKTLLSSARASDMLFAFQLMAKPVFDRLEQLFRERVQRAYTDNIPSIISEKLTKEVGFESFVDPSKPSEDWDLGGLAAAVEREFGVRLSFGDLQGADAGLFRDYVELALAHHFAHRALEARLTQIHGEFFTAAEKLRGSTSSMKAYSEALAKAHAERMTKAEKAFSEGMITADELAKTVQDEVSALKQHRESEAHALELENEARQKLEKEKRKKIQSRLDAAIEGMQSPAAPALGELSRARKRELGKLRVVEDIQLVAAPIPQVQVVQPYQVARVDVSVPSAATARAQTIESQIQAMRDSGERLGLVKSGESYQLIALAADGKSHTVHELGIKEPSREYRTLLSILSRNYDLMGVRVTPKGAILAGHIEGEAFLDAEAGSIVMDAKIKGELHIAQGAVVATASLGGGQVGPHSVVKNVDVKGKIQAGEGSRVEFVKAGQVIVGNESVLLYGKRENKRIEVGDRQYRGQDVDGVWKARGNENLARMILEGRISTEMRPSFWMSLKMWFLRILYAPEIRKSDPLPVKRFKRWLNELGKALYPLILSDLVMRNKLQDEIRWDLRDLHDYRRERLARALLAQRGIHSDDKQKILEAALTTFQFDSLEFRILAKRLGHRAFELWLKEAYGVDLTVQSVHEANQALRERPELAREYGKEGGQRYDILAGLYRRFLMDKKTSDDFSKKAAEESSFFKGRPVRGAWGDAPVMVQSLAEKLAMLELNITREDLAGADIRTQYEALVKKYNETLALELQRMASWDYLHYERQNLAVQEVRTRLDGWLKAGDYAAAAEFLVSQWEGMSPSANRPNTKDRVALVRTVRELLKRGDLKVHAERMSRFANIPEARELIVRYRQMGYDEATAKIMANREWLKQMGHPDYWNVVLEVTERGSRALSGFWAINDAKLEDWYWASGAEAFVSAGSWDPAKREDPGMLLAKTGFAVIGDKWMNESDIHEKLHLNFPMPTGVDMKTNDIEEIINLLTQMESGLREEGLDGMHYTREKILGKLRSYAARGQFEGDPELAEAVLDAALYLRSVLPMPAVMKILKNSRSPRNLLMWHLLPPEEIKRLAAGTLPEFPEDAAQLLAGEDREIQLSTGKEGRAQVDLAVIQKQVQEALNEDRIDVLMARLLAGGAISVWTAYYLFRDHYEDSVVQQILALFVTGDKAYENLTSLAAAVLKVYPGDPNGAISEPILRGIFEAIAKNADETQIQLLDRILRSDATEEEGGLKRTVAARVWDAMLFQSVNNPALKEFLKANYVTQVDTLTSLLGDIQSGKIPNQEAIRALQSLPTADALFDQAHMPFELGLSLPADDHAKMQPSDQVYAVTGARRTGYSSTSIVYNLLFMLHNHPMHGAWAQVLPSGEFAQYDGLLQFTEKTADDKFKRTGYGYIETPFGILRYSVVSTAEGEMAPSGSSVTFDGKMHTIEASIIQEHNQDRQGVPSKLEELAYGLAAQSKDFTMVLDDKLPIKFEFRSWQSLAQRKDISAFVINGNGQSMVQPMTEEQSQKILTELAKQTPEGRAELRLAATPAQVAPRAELKEAAITPVALPAKGVTEGAKDREALLNTAFENGKVTVQQIVPNYQFPKEMPEYRWASEEDLRLRMKGNVAYFDEGKNEIVINYEKVKDLPEAEMLQNLEIAMVHELIHAAGGSEVEAYTAQVEAMKKLAPERFASQIDLIEALLALAQGNVSDITIPEREKLQILANEILIAKGDRAQIFEEILNRLQSQVYAIGNTPLNAMAGFIPLTDAEQVGGLIERKFKYEATSREHNIFTVTTQDMENIPGLAAQVMRLKELGYAVFEFDEAAIREIFGASVDPYMAVARLAELAAALGKSQFDKLMMQYEIQPRGANGLYSVKACLSGVIKTLIGELVTYQSIAQAA